MKVEIQETSPEPEKKPVFSDPQVAHKRAVAASERRKARVTIKHPKVEGTSKVLPESVQAWKNRGWTVVDDGDSEPATRRASAKEKN